MIRVVKRWNRLPTEVIDDPSLETINLICLKLSLTIAEGLDWVTFKDPLQPKLFYDS